MGAGFGMYLSSVPIIGSGGGSGNGQVAQKQLVLARDLEQFSCFSLWAMCKLSHVAAF
jgi:hypothetical protein